MKTIKTLITAASIAAIASTASATMTFSQEKTGGPLATLNANNNNQSWGFNEGGFYQNSLNDISGVSGLLSGVDWNMYEIVSAVVTFGFADKAHYKNDQGDYDVTYWGTLYKGTEFAKATVGNDDVYLQGDEHNGNDAVEVDGNHYNSPNNYDYHSGEVDASEFGDLEDGNIQFRVTADEGDFYLKTANIVVTVEEKPTHSVPDSGATAILLGGALIGLAAVRRKLSK